MRVILFFVTKSDRRFGEKFYKSIYASIVVDLVFFFLIFYIWLHVKVLFSYIFSVNIVAFLYYGLDKSLAQREAFRLPEKILLGLAFIGGSIGALFGMFLFHHKTKKASFQVWFWILIIIQIIIVYAIHRYILR